MTKETNSKRVSWIVNAIIILVMLISFSVFKEIGRNVGRSAAKSLIDSYESGANDVFESDKTVAAILKNCAETINKQCPMKIDKYTTALCVFPSNRKLIYQYQLDINRLIKDTNTDLTTLKNFMKQHKIKSFCSNPSFDKFKEHNIDMEYQYIDLEGKFLFKFVINKGLCN